MANTVRKKPGIVRDAILNMLWNETQPVSVSQIHKFVNNEIGEVPRSSVQSFLNKNQPLMFSKVSRGKYILTENIAPKSIKICHPYKCIGKSRLYHGNSFNVLSSFANNSIQAVVTDPPYGVVEYSEKEIKKLRSGRGGVWRVPPSFDGHTRSPLPRFTTLKNRDLENLEDFFHRLGKELIRVLVPGAHVMIASNPLVSHLVTIAMIKAGFENRGCIIRQVITMRGGDRPKNAHEEFSDVSVMPRSAWEPWVLVRKPVENRVQDNLRKWGTGGLRRISDDQPFFDVIKSSPTQKNEKILAPHPSLKPQKLLRQLVRASLPIGEGIILDPFSGSGSTLAAANALGLQSIGIELDLEYYNKSDEWITKLSEL